MKIFENMSIRNKIFITGSLLIVVFLFTIFAYLFPSMKSNIVEMKKIKLKEIVRCGTSIVQSCYQEYQDGKISEPEAKEKAIVLLKAFRYGPHMKDYLWINDFQPKMIMHPYSPELINRDLNDHKDPNGIRIFVEMVKVCRAEGDGFISYMWQWKDDKNKIVPKISYVKLFGPWKWIVGTGLYVEDAKSEIETLQGNLKTNLVIIFIVISALLFVLLFRISSAISGPVKKIMHFAKNMAEGDLSNRIDVIGNDEISHVSKALNKSVEQVSTLIIGIKTKIKYFAEGINEIAVGNEDLSQRVAEQAASIEEIVATIEESNASIKNTAAKTNEGNKLTKQSVEMAKTGGEQVDSALKYINEVNVSSKQIGEIISIINEISFQTNLLALNAAVEAARAGEHGKGFAVVASEVRNLAQKSSNAAKEIDNLIKETLEKIDHSTKLSNSSNDALKEIIESITSVSHVVTDVSMSLDEQKQGIEQINHSILEVDSITQSNTSLVEETAAASKEISDKVVELLAMINKFKVSG